MRRPFVGGRSLLACVGGLRQLGLGPRETLDQLGNLTGKLEHGPVLLLDMALQEGETLFEVVKPGIHGQEDGPDGPEGQDSAVMTITTGCP